MREYREMALTVIAIFVLTFLGALYSPTFEEQRGFLELFMVLGSLLFIFSLLVIVTFIGFRSFAFYAAVVLAIVMVMFGVYGAFLVVFMTYLMWGFVFGIETLLVGHRVKSAIEWFRGRYTFESFYIEYRVFYPMIMIVYFFVELLPGYLGLDKPKRFEAAEIIERMREILE